MSTHPRAASLLSRWHGCAGSPSGQQVQRRPFTWQKVRHVALSLSITLPLASMRHEYVHAH